MPWPGTCGRTSSNGHVPGGKDQLLRDTVTCEAAAFSTSAPASPSTGRASEYLARMMLSFIGSQGQWDLTDRAQVATLVRTEFRAGFLERP
ncbi:MAG: hypothetical protein M3083_17435 [Actinomycetota bacterium]|nr:hypothetical protein [Actinomycetota bacterium]